MNRKILYRGKRKDNGDWIEGFYVEDENNNPYIIIDSAIAFEGKLSKLFIKVIRETVCRYIGCYNKDKLFEDDILAITYRKFDNFLETYIGVIKYCDYQYKVIEKEALGTKFDKTFGVWLGGKSIIKITKLGNIHDNPELLKI